MKRVLSRTPRTLRQSLFWAFGAMALVGATVASTAFFLLESSLRRATDSLARDAAALSSLARFERAAMSLDHQTRRYLSSRDPEVLARSNREAAEFLRARKALLEGVPVSAENQGRDLLLAAETYLLERERALQRKGDAGHERAADALANAVAAFRVPFSAAMLQARQDARVAVRRSRWIAGGALLVIAGAMVFVGMFIKRRIIEPVATLAHFAAQVGRAGEGGPRPVFPRLEARGGDEIAVLSSSLDAMSKRLEDQVRRLHELDEAKTKFLSMVSHEFRIPLTAVGEYAAMLREGVAGTLDERQVEYLEVIERNAVKLKALTENLLSVAKIEAGRFSVMPKAVDLAKLLTQLGRALAPLGRDAGITVSVQIGVIPAVSADPDLLELALTNLVGNAIKYNRPGGSVRIEARSKGGLVRVSVADTGRGFRPEDRARLFSPFFRGVPTESKGTGLGLPITKEILDAHGSSIQVESSPGEGTRFEFTLKEYPTG